MTMVEFQKAEEAREKAEKQRGIADRAYRESISGRRRNLSTFAVSKCRRKLQQHAPTALTVIMGLERVGINMPLVRHGSVAGLTGVL